MKEAGFSYVKHKKNYYVDWHDIEDVIADQMIIQANDAPPIFDSTAEKLDQQVAVSNQIRKLAAAEF